MVNLLMSKLVSYRSKQKREFCNFLDVRYGSRVENGEVVEVAVGEAMKVAGRCGVDMRPRGVADGCDRMEAMSRKVMDGCNRVEAEKVKRVSET